MSRLSSLGGGDVSQSSTQPSSSFGSVSGFSNLGSIGATDLSTVDGLLALAESRGGAIGQAAEELVHPKTGILSTISDGFKKSFKGFVDIISTPSQAVAGIISSKYTVGEAIDQNISPSDVIFGAKNPNATTMQKVGSFLTRTATDILLDPLTYLTFGGAKGIFGLASLPKITLGEKAAASIGKDALSTAVLSDEGAELLTFLGKVEKQRSGLLTAEKLKISGKSFLESADNTYDFAKSELDELLTKTIDAPLDMDYAKKAISNLLEKKPELAPTLLDKGGIKFFGKSILSGQRISATMQMIPGMSVIDHATQPIRMAIGSLFDPSVIKVGDDFVRLPEEFVNLESTARSLAESTKDARYSNLVNIVKANKLTSNEAKLLTAATEAGIIPTDTRLANAYKQMLGFNEDEIKFLRESGIPIAFRDKHVPHVLIDTEVKSTPFTLPPSTKVGAAMQRTKDSTIFNSEGVRTAEEALAKGDIKLFNDTLDGMRNAGMDIFDDNIFTAHLTRTTQNVRAGVTKQFVESAAQKFGALKNEAPAGWVPINSAAIKKEGDVIIKALGEATYVNGKQLEELVFHPAIAKRIEEFSGAIINDEATNNFLKHFDSLQNLWKAGVTSVFPAFHGRNAISNVFLHMMDLGTNSLNPVNHAMAGQIVYSNNVANKLMQRIAGSGDDAVKAAEEFNELMGKRAFTDARGYEWSFGELRQVLKDKGVAFTRSVTGPLDIREGLDEVTRQLFPDEGTSFAKAKGLVKKSLPVSQEFIPFKAGRAVGNMIEEQARVLDFVTNLRATGDVAHAAQRTKQFLFDYSNLTAFEKTFLRRIIPFYTFTRKNLELQAKTLMTTPGRVAAQLTTLNNLGEAISGGELTDEEYKALPDWVKTGIGVLASKKGSTVTLLTGFGTPIEQPFQALQPNALLGSISPLLRVPVEQMSGYSFFQGKMLSDVTNAAAFRTAPKAMKDFIGYTEIKGEKSDGTPFTWYVSLRPERMNVVNNLPLVGRVLSSLKQMDAVDVSNQYKIMQQLVGIRPYSFDVEQEAAKREKEMMTKLESLLTKAGVTAQFKRTFIPKEN